MKERPILFSGPMVRAILEGRKTMTRRAMKPQPHDGVDSVEWQDCIITGCNTPDQSGFAMMRDGVIESEAIRCHYGAPGDRLWVRETFGYPEQNEDNGVVYRATDPTWDEATTKYCKTMLWNPSIFMPRWASRITLEITGVRVERLREISGRDAIAEGVEHFTVNVGDATVTTFRDYLTGETNRAARQSFETLWKSINGADSWDANPWVWVVEFRRVEK